MLRTFLLTLLASTLLALALLPLPASLPGAGGDSSWAWALQEFRVRGTRWGTDAVFTYGPLGFVHPRMYDPRTFFVVFSCWAALAILGAVALVRISTVLSRPTIWTVGTAALLAWLAAGHPDSAVILVLAVMARALLAPQDRISAVDVTLAISAGIIGLTKGTFLCLAVALALSALACVPFERLARLRVLAGVDGSNAPYRSAVVGISIALGLFGGAFALGQRPVDVLRFLECTIDLASGYPDLASLEGPTTPAMAYLVTLAVLLLGLVKRCSNGQLPATPAYVVWVGLAGFLAFRAGFTRQDSHVGIAVHSLAGIVLLNLDLWFCGGTRATVLAGRAALALAAALGVFAHQSRQGQLGLWDTGVLQLNEMGVRARHLLALGRTLEDHHTAFAIARERIGRASGLIGLNGSVDVLSTRFAPVLAAGLDWRPRPVFQSHLVTTDALAQRNARWLEGSNAPETLLVSLESIDHHPPLLEDPAIWPVVFSHYDATDLRGPWLVMRRVHVPGVCTRGPERTVRGMLQEEISIPETGPGAVWARVEVLPSLPGCLRAALLRPAPLALDLQRSDGVWRTFRIPAQLARSGFILSPLVETTGDLRTVALAVGGREIPRVRKLRLRPEDETLKWAFAEEIRVTVSSLTISPAPRWIHDAWRADLPVSNRSPISRDGPAPRGVSLPGLGPVTLAPSGSRLSFPVSPLVHSLELGYGVLRPGGEDLIAFTPYEEVQGPRVAGIRPKELQNLVMFQVKSEGPGHPASGTVLAVQFLPTDRSTWEAGATTVRLSPGTKTLSLETLYPFPITIQPGMPVWTRIRFRDGSPDR